MKKNILIGLSGASGVIYGIKLLKILKNIPDITVHLIITKAGIITIKQETNDKISDIVDLADYYHNNQNISASIASGSFELDSMIISACTASTLAKIASGLSIDLISRVADVMLKERRKLILMFRETPFHLIHIENMLKVTKMGAIISPPMPAFYNQPHDIDDLIDYSLIRILDLIGIRIETKKRWNGVDK